MHSSSGRVSRGVQKTTGETAGFWRDTGFDRLQQRTGTKHHEQTRRQADQPADNRAGSLPFSAPCSISSERSVFAMCVLRFVFCLLLFQHGFIDEKSTCFSCFALQFCIYIVCPKIKKKCRKLAFSALWKHEYMISAWRTAVHDVQPSDRTSPQGAKLRGIQFPQKSTQITH